MTASIPVFADGRLDRADQLRSKPDLIAAAMRKPSARLLRMDGLGPVFDSEGHLAWTNVFEANPANDLLLLGLDGDIPCFAELTGAGDVGPANPRLWQSLALLPPEQAAIYATARSLVDWHARHGFCARCGAATSTEKGGWARKCDSCGAEHFPRVDPVAIMLAEHDGMVLMGRQPRFPPKRFSALAGFIEPGESIEGGVARELWEEAGIKVRNVRYIASQPWPFPSSLMIGCTSITDDPTLNIDTEELEEARWFTRAEVVAAMDGDPDAPFIAPPPFAIAHNLLVFWLAETK